MRKLVVELKNVFCDARIDLYLSELSRLFRNRLHTSLAQMNNRDQRQQAKEKNCAEHFFALCQVELGSALESLRVRAFTRPTLKCF